MTTVTIYVARPSTARGLWRVSTSGRAEQFQPSEDEAVKAAVWLARFLEEAGEETVVKVEEEGGHWRIARA